MKLAVYGTLKSNKKANQLMAGCILLGPSKLPGYALYNQHGLPVLVKEEGSSVMCEVWAIKPSALDAIDTYEGFISEDNPHNLFNRVKAYTVDQEMVNVYVYNGQLQDDAELILNGEW